MDALFQKLNLKPGMPVVVLNAPDEFASVLESLADFKVVTKLNEAAAIRFALAFVTRQDEVNALSAAMAAKADGDCLLWFAYPKTTSKKYRCEFNRDTGWAALGALGYEPVRQVALDVDWSALRFRRVEFIKKMIRSEKMAMTEAGKKKASRSRQALEE